MILTNENIIEGVLIGVSLALLIVAATKKAQPPLSYARLLQLQQQMLLNQQGPHRRDEEDGDWSMITAGMKAEHFHEHGQNCE